MTFRGQIKAGMGALLGDAGEHFVMGELLRRGIVAALAPRNIADYDILAVGGKRSVKIRVKTKTAAAATFVWNAKKDGTIFRNITDNDFTVLVDLSEPGAPPSFYVVPTASLEARLERRYRDWLASPGVRGRVHQENKMRRLDDPNWKTWLESYEGADGWLAVITALGPDVEP